MAKKYFIPSDDLGKVNWLNNFSRKLSRYAAKYGISAAELADMVASAAAFAFWVGALTSIRTFSQSATAYKNEQRDGLGADQSTDSTPPELPDLGTAPATVPSGIFDRASAIAGRIKKFQSYTIADGEDLGIEGAEQGNEEPTPPVA